MAEFSEFISRLPEPVLHQILFCLPIKKAAQASTLSKTWYKLWKTLPFLNFDESFYHGVNNTQDIIRLLEVIDIELMSRKEGNVNILDLTLHLPVALESITDMYLARWSRFVAHSKIKHLSFTSHHPEPGAIIFNLTPRLLVANYLVKLNLFGCTLSSNNHFHDEFHLPSLMYLSLKNVCADDELIKMFLRRSPFLKRLILQHSYGFKVIKVVRQKGMEKIEVTNCRDVEVVKVDAPSLDFLKIILDSPTELEISEKTGMNLTQLILCGVNITDEWLSNFICGCPILRNMSLMKCHMLKNIRVCSDSLQSLDIYRCKNVEGVKEESPNLRLFSLYVDDVVPITVSVPHVVDVKLFCHPTKVDLDWQLEFLELLKKFYHCTTVRLSTSSDMDSLFPKKIREEFKSPLSNVRHLEISQLFLSDTLEMVKLMLWLSPRPKTLRVLSEILPQENKAIELYYDESLEEVCWHHCLKEVVIENLNPDEDYGLINYLRFNARNSIILHAGGDV